MENLDFFNANHSESETSAQEPKVFSISQINSLIRQKLEGDFSLIWVRGEISNFKAHTSGHFYFSLKDEGAQINAVMFKGLNTKLKFRPENGMEVLVRGKVTVYEPRGNYQIFCEHMEPVGAGALQKAFEQLKAKLQAEGLFALERKRKLPEFPKHIGLVTSPTGAALKDILNVLRRRFKGARITLAPALVQGDEAPKSIVAAISLINQVSDIDVLIVGRGGGSIEDLWAFNSELVARAVANSRIPTISAVGHEIDFTICDFVADLRAPTPSAAAELVAKSIYEIEDKIKHLQTRLWQSLKSSLHLYKERIHSLGRRLIDPQRRLQDLQLRNDELVTRLEHAVFRYIEDRRLHVELALKKMGSPREHLAQLNRRLQIFAMRLSSFTQQTVDRKMAKLQSATGRLDAMSPLRVVARGYSIVEKSGHIVKDVSNIKMGDLVKLRFAKGEATAKIENITTQD